MWVSIRELFNTCDFIFFFFLFIYLFFYGGGFDIIDT